MGTTRRSSRLNSQVDTDSSGSSSMPPPSQPAKRKRATTTTTTTSNPEPSTPTKRRVQAHAAPPPLTPTPSRAKFIGQPAADVATPRNRRVARLADPNATNATLLSPETSRVVTSEIAEPPSPSKLPRQTTTQTLLQEACAHLIKVDERMRPLVANNHCHVFSPEGLAEKVDPFESLCSGIISQQVSGAAAKSIKAKFVALFEPTARFPHPSEVVALSLERLRTAGLSQRKAEYIHGLAEKFANGELSAQILHDASYEEVMEKLIAVRGLGKWSVEMFACFALKRMDVFSLGDLGVQRGMAAFVGKDVAKLKSKGGKWKYMTEKEMIEFSDRFSPYRSLLMWMLWRVEETDVSTME